MSNPTSVVTERRLEAFYQEILPYLGGSADAGFTPVGSVIAIMGVTAPANYLACNGQIVNVADYPELATYFEQQFGTKYKFGGSGTTFGIPDLRGEFLRGTGTNSHNNSYTGANEGSGSDVGVHQSATVEQSLNQYSGQLYFGKDTSLTISTPAFMDSQSKSNTYQYLSNGTSGTQADRTLLHTTRPTNTSILWCIATKDIYLNPAMDYSTSEKVVGKWIDGKTLYQKTIPFTTPSPTTNYVAVTENIPNSYIANLDEMVYLEGFYKHANSPLFNFINVAQGSEDATKTGAVFVYYADDSPYQCFRISNSIISHGGRNGYLTVRYTKTT